MAIMNNRRHSFELVSFRGKLIAGGVAVFFDPVQNRTVEQETNLTEPNYHGFLELPNASHKFSAFAATVMSFTAATRHRVGPVQPTTRPTATTRS